MNLSTVCVMMTSLFLDLCAEFHFWSQLYEVLEGMNIVGVSF